mgnify:CR=1 FL=1
MKHLLKAVLVLTCTSLLASFAMSAQAREKMLIALKTSDFELTKTDISSLAIGESKTIETGNGKVIDILRTGDGAEIYVDGQLLDINQPHQGHDITQHIEVICEDDENCDEDVLFNAGHGSGQSGWVTEEGDTVFIHKEIILACNDGENSSCSDKTNWVNEAGDFDLEELHEGEGGHKIIVIEKEILVED